MKNSVGLVLAALSTMVMACGAATAAPKAGWSNGSKVDIVAREGGCRRHCGG